MPRERQETELESCFRFHITSSQRSVETLASFYVKREITESVCFSSRRMC